MNIEGKHANQHLVKELKHKDNKGKSMTHVLYVLQLVKELCLGMKQH